MINIEKELINKSYKKELKKLKHDQVTDIWAPFSRRIGRHVRIKLIEYMLNKKII